MKRPKRRSLQAFVKEAEQIVSLLPLHRVGSLGGYGHAHEVLYDKHPYGCPSVLVDRQGDATLTLQSNGSVSFVVKQPEGMEVRVLEGHFDPVEKRECGVPSGNVWLALSGDCPRRVVSLLIPWINLGCTLRSLRVVKLGDPVRAMWYVGTWATDEVGWISALRMRLTLSPYGPVLLRELYVKATGRCAFPVDLWTCYNLHGTQRFAYNKEIWYDAGLPVTPWEIVAVARVPYSDRLQIKRLSSDGENIRAVESTCDYAVFVGDTACSVAFPRAVLEGRFLAGGAGMRLNRFASPTIGASHFRAWISPHHPVLLRQRLLFVTDGAVAEQFRKRAASDIPRYRALARTFDRAARALIRETGFRDVTTEARHSVRSAWPFFAVELPAEPVLAEYAHSVWTGVRELYENCRAHGARLADGIELGTRDRAQDMWPMMKEDPGRVRADLVHAFGFLYQTVDGPFPTDRPLTLREKLHGMFPRQYPSRWDNRHAEIHNDNRPYADSALWLLNALVRYIRETGDRSILLEHVPTVCLTHPDQPESSGLVGAHRTLRLIEAATEALASYERHVADSPYGLAQVLYGDWCDPVDMFGTAEVGNPGTRGQGRGASIRLSAHLFLTLVEMVDLCSAPRVAAYLTEHRVHVDVARWQRLADRLRLQIVRVGWEEGPRSFPAGFLSYLHERKRDGSRPDVTAGETGYTLGSFLGRDFDGQPRRELTAQAWVLGALCIERPWLTPVPNAPTLVARTLRTVDQLFFAPRLGFLLFTRPIPNNHTAVACVGRMGVLPVGTAENGEYHHAQIMMHTFRLGLPGQADTVWHQFKPMISAFRGELLAGPFETPCTSYVSDPDDPHFGKGMYFGLSGSVDWIVEFFERIAGLRLALHDDTQPALSVRPCLPTVLGHRMTFRRVLHLSDERGGYRPIPFSLELRAEGVGRILRQQRVVINGRSAERAEIQRLDCFDRVEMVIVGVFGRSRSCARTVRTRLIP